MSRSSVIVETSQLQRWGGLLDAEIVAVAGRVQAAVVDEQAEIQARATRAVPVGATGALKGSIRPTGRGLTRRVRAGGARAFYAPFQEFGVVHHRAQPFLIVQADRQTHTEFERKVSAAVLAGGIYR